MLGFSRKRRHHAHNKTCRRHQRQNAAAASRFIDTGYRPLCRNRCPLTEPGSDNGYAAMTIINKEEI